MKQKIVPIQRKLMQVIMMACGVVLLLTCAAFFIYEFLTYRDFTKRELSTLGEIIAANSSGALAFEDKENADEVLSPLNAQRHIVAACLYDKRGNIFAIYPKDISATVFPSTPPLQTGYHFTGEFLEGFEQVFQNDNFQGTLYLKSDLQGIKDRFVLYAVIAILFILLSFLFAYLISMRLQRSISNPILKLAETARMVSDKRDYSVRATNRSNDEVGILTDAFNHMLTEIQSQSRKIQSLNAGLEEKVALRTRELQEANAILMQQNEFIQTIIDSSVDVIAVFNRELEYVILNQRSDDVYPVKRKDLIGKKITEVFPATKGAVMEQNLRRALAGEFVHHDVYKSVATDRHFETFFIPLKDKDGNIDRVLVIAHDITKIMQANEQLKLLNTELEKSNRDLEQFAYVASHDLQEPLRKIQIFSELSERNLRNPEILTRYLQKINSSGARMSELIRAVLNYSKLSRINKEFSEIDLNKIIANIKGDLELVIEEKKAVIAVQPLPVIWGNALQMHQLFLNLVTNALKFSEKQPHIVISSAIISGTQARLSDGLKKAGSYLELAVADNGIGFEPQYAEQIFAIFQRLHSGNEYAGTGIGLALCKKIAENHDGVITAHSEPGKGSTFYVYLPATRIKPAYENRFTEEEQTQPG
jgi:PAS domain S-box-containing protein